MSSPTITVLMPVFNAEKYIGQAIESILGQTFQDFELVIIDDGSTDHSAEKVTAYDDHRIRFFKNERNLGLVYTLNRGIEISRGHYIARMDADDISLPDRLSLQVQFLDTHPAISTIGTNMIFVDADGKGLRTPHWNVPENSVVIHWWLLMGLCGVNHPTVMVRTDTYRKLNGYDSDFIHCEDYELWLRCCRETKIANLAQACLMYRMHSSNVTSVHNETQRQNVVRALHVAICKLLERSVPIEIVHDLMLGEPLYSQRSALAANLLEEMLDVFIAETCPSPAEQKEIRCAAADRLIGMAHHVFLRDPLSSMKLLGKSYRFSGLQIMPILARKIAYRIPLEYP